MGSHLSHVITKPFISGGRLTSTIGRTSRSFLGDHRGQPTRLLTHFISDRVQNIDPSKALSRRRVRTSLNGIVGLFHLLRNGSLFNRLCGGSLTHHLLCAQSISLSLRGHFITELQRRYNDACADRLRDVFQSLSIARRATATCTGSSLNGRDGADQARFGSALVSCKV